MTININIHWPRSKDFETAVLAAVKTLETALGSANLNQEKRKRMISTDEQAILDRLTAAIAKAQGVAQALRDLQANPPADDSEFDAKLNGLLDTLDSAVGTSGTGSSGPTP